jgi:hypothetical protein
MVTLNNNEKSILDNSYWIVVSQNYPPCYLESLDLWLDSWFPTKTKNGQTILWGDGNSVLLAPGPHKNLFESIILDAEMEIICFRCNSDEIAIENYKHYSLICHTVKEIQFYIGMRLLDGIIIDCCFVLLHEGWYKIHENGERTLSFPS